MTTRRSGALRYSALVAACASIGAAVTPAAAAGSEWREAMGSRTRLLAASVETGGARTVYAFVELAMGQGWKTYWRNPGDAGGLPPRFEWGRSENLAKATVLYPAPRRLTDEAGDTIGYKEHVIFPVVIEAKDASKPVRLALEVTYGICKDICVPSDAAHDLEVAPGVGAAEASLLAALESVPRQADQQRPGDPMLRSGKLDAGGGKPKLVLEADFPGGADAADVFVEAPGDLYVPMPGKAGSPAGDVQRFEAELGAALELKDLAGKEITVTLVGPKGSSFAKLKIQ